MTGAPEPGEQAGRGGRTQPTALHAIIEHVADGIVLVSRDGAIRFANPAAERLFGRSVEELLGEDFGFPLAPDHRAEIDVVRPGGSTVVAELRTVEMEWEGEPSILVSLRDVTDRRAAEERLHELIRVQAERATAEEEMTRFRFLAEAGAILDSSLDYTEVMGKLARLVVSPGEAGRVDGGPQLPPLADWCAIDVIESDGSIARVAAAHRDESLLPLLEELRERFPPSWSGRYPAARALRERRSVLFPRVDDGMLAGLTRGPEHAALLRRLGLRSAIALPLVARGETVGAITLARGDASYDESDFTFVSDLARRTALALANARLFREASDANRAKSDFLAVMSHELRTPLNAIMGYTDLLQAEIPGELNDRQKAQLARIGDASQHLLRIVEEILTYARLEAGRAELHEEPVELESLLHEVVSMVDRQAHDRGLRLTVATWGPLEMVTDAGKLRQIVLNLVSNAVKFTEQGEVRVELESDDAAHRIRVRDTGPGIPPEALERIFEPFWQVEQSSVRAAGGTGLGLSVAQRLARLLGGSLHVESEVGRGSTFTLFLPRTPRGESAARDAGGADGIGTST